MVVFVYVEGSCAYIIFMKMRLQWGHNNNND